MDITNAEIYQSFFSKTFMMEEIIIEKHKYSISIKKARMMIVIYMIMIIIMIFFSPFWSLVW